MVVRLRLPEKLARTLVEEELPVLDRPLRFVVTRGARGAVRATDLQTLQERLDLPFTEQERRADDSSNRGREERASSSPKRRGTHGARREEIARGGHRGKPHKRRRR